MIALTRAWDAERVAEEIGSAHRVIISDPTRDFPYPGIRQDGGHLDTRKNPRPFSFAVIH